MRRFAAVAITSGALVAGLTATVSPASASTTQSDNTVAAESTAQGRISGTALIAQAKREGTPYSAKEAAAIRRSTYCTWAQVTRGRKYKGSKHWAFYVRTRLNWCYTGYQVVSAKGHYSVYSRNKRVYRFHGWYKHKLTHDRTWATVKADARVKFSYGSRVYRPWATVMGTFQGKHRTWTGG
ncbi:hypothetical protein J4573_45835 [Actinomadura barringtoniae]|uniref:Uncharacterized protein n=1 Tax=Actinomadura barringtoniae TaxID=1427535 RepID=A0A939T8S6_9ACTN|nr:hypothetical protein [Actinomadura barringtoniae]MBO2454478.1 hypothetical protein [Actinomadura barringtoniae]